MTRRRWVVSFLVILGVISVGFACADSWLSQYRTGLTIGNVAVQKFVSKTGRWQTDYAELAADYGPDELPASVETVSLSQSINADTLEVIIKFKGVFGRTIGFRHRRGVPGCETF